MLNKRISFYIMLTLIFSLNVLAQDLSSGIKLIRNEKFSEAKKYFLSQLNSKLKGDAHFYLGQIYFVQGKIDSAYFHFNEGINLDNDNALNFAGMCKLDYNDGNITLGEQNYNHAIDKGEDNALTYITLSEAFSNPKVKNYDRAIELLTKSLKLKKKDINSYISLGNVYVAKGNGTDALKNFSAALDMDGKNPVALTQKAKIYILISNNDAGIELLNEAIASDPSYSPAYLELAECYANLKNYPKAAENYSKYIEASESTNEKLKRYAQILYVNKEYAKDIAILEEVIKSESDISSSVRIIAYSYLRMEETEKSKSYFEKLFSLPNVEFQPTDYENYGDLLSKTGEDSLAIAYYENVVLLDSTRKDLYGKMSVLYFKNKKWDGVVSSLEKKGTLTAQEYFDLGKANMFLGDKAVAEVTESLNSSLTLTDDQKWNFVRPALLYYQGDLRDAQGDSTKIEAAINKVSLFIEPSIVNGQKIKWPFTKPSWLREVRSKIGLNYTKADTALTALVQKVPDLAVAYFWKARVKTNFDPESKLGLAKPYYEEFIERTAAEKDKFKKELIESNQYLGYYYYLQEDNAKSKVYWQEVINLDPENKQANDVIKMLK